MNRGLFIISIIVGFIAISAIIFYLATGQEGFMLVLSIVLFFSASLAFISAVRKRL